MIKVGDFVTRKSYDNDIIFRVIDIKNNNCILYGLCVRLTADSPIDDLIIYDNVPGGAGHVKRLTDKHSIKKVLSEALKVVSQNCCDENTSCYQCLRNYYNQFYHSKLRRIYAQEILKELLQEVK